MRWRRDADAGTWKARAGRLTLSVWQSPHGFVWSYGVANRYGSVAVLGGGNQRIGDPDTLTLRAAKDAATREARSFAQAILNDTRAP
jgi:hypothetical protein